jgi:SpoVK/Ycf46/Vps4 family AAA+-type ATPase
MVGQKAFLKEEDYDKIAEMSAGFSGADMKSLCQDASYGPIRDIVHLLEDITPERVGYYCYLGLFYLFLISEFNYCVGLQVRPIEVADFIRSLKRVKSSVADKDLSIYEEWDRQFGCHAED